MRPIGTETWIGWIMAMVATGISFTYYGFTTFETKADSIDQRDQVVKRLERIETKIDKVLSDKNRH